MPAKPTNLREELRQTKPFESPSHEAVLGLQRTFDLIRREFAKIVDPVDLSAQQYNVLRILRGAGEQCLPTLEIAERMVEKTPGITRLLDKLEAKHLVRRRRCSEDRRQVLCYITPAGLALLAQIDPAISAAAPRLLRSLDEAETQSLIRLLEKIRAALD